ncbi:MAG: EAL domain-containing protein [Sphingorhabdus sp.]
MLLDGYLKSAAQALGLLRPNDVVVIEQYRVLGQQVPTLYLLLIANCLFLASVSVLSVDPWLAFGLPLVLLSPIFFRLCVWRRPDFANNPADADAMRSELKRTMFLAVILSLGLSFWSVMLVHEIAPVHRLFLPLFAAISTIASAYCLLSLPAAAYVVIGFGTGPISVALLMAGDGALETAGVNLLAAGVLMVRMVSSQFGLLEGLVNSRSLMLEEKARADELAYHDDLTSLHNRRAFMAALCGCENLDSHSGIAVIMIDLDGFKPINDTYGHAAGDAILVEAARRLADAVPGGADIARLGGDEFSVLLGRIENRQAVETIARDISDCFRSHFQAGAQSFRVSASIGFSFEQGPVQGSIALLNQADIALYSAKTEHEKAPIFFSPAMEANVRRRMMIEQALADPIQHEAITLNYQPLYDARQLKVIGFEALARWNHPELGAISPSEFVIIAEQSGMTDILTAKLLRRALGDAANWPAPLSLSFNLSAAELNSAHSHEIIVSLLDEFGFDPSRLAIEVTETALLKDFAIARDLLDQLRQAGVRIWLDDFGAGYASIGYLRQIKFDMIKLDGGIIEHVLKSAEARDLLAGILSLCQAIQTPVVVEMIETREQLALLSALPISVFQGFYFARPMSAAEVADSILLEAQRMRA